MWDEGTALLIYHNTALTLRRKDMVQPDEWKWVTQKKRNNPSLDRSVGTTLWIHY